MKSDLSPAHKDICVALSCVMPRHPYLCMEHDYFPVRPAEACSGYCAPGDGASALPWKRNHFPPAGNGFPWWHHPALRVMFHRCLPFPQICFGPTCEEPHACAVRGRSGNRPPHRPSSPPTRFREEPYPESIHFRKAIQCLTVKLSDRRSGCGTCRRVERWWWSVAGAGTAEPVSGSE